ncbi:MAG: CRISPR-associated endonuclease Cas3'', partial [Minicystis sp.]
MLDGSCRDQLDHEGRYRHFTQLRRAATLGPSYAHSPPDGLTWDQAHELRDHLEAVAELAQGHASAFGIPEWGHLAGLWHDLGKYRPGFQQYIRGELIPMNLKSHKLAGAAHALKLEYQVAGQLLALCIAGHHGGLPQWQGVSSLQDRLPEA